MTGKIVGYMLKMIPQPRDSVCKTRKECWLNVILFNKFKKKSLLVHRVVCVSWSCRSCIL